LKRRGRRSINASQERRGGSSWPAAHYRPRAAVAWIVRFGSGAGLSDAAGAHDRPFGAGGPADVYARIIAQHLSEQLKQTFIVENRPGAGSIIGTDAVAKSAARRLHAAGDVEHPHDQRVADREQAVPADARLRAGGAVNYSDLIMVVHPSVPAKDLKEFIALAKSKPGELNYARPARARRITWPASCSKR
jgi:tripartite-type tricarboxylate transporter receptor subunit TctC